MNKAIDISNWQPVPTASQVACWRNSGFNRAIIGASFGDGMISRHQLQACINGGMEVEVYAWLRWNDAWQPPINRALEAIGGLPVKRVWIDCEDPTNWNQQKIAARIHQCQQYINARRTDLNCKAIYTGKWWWDRYMPTNQEFSSWQLWTASGVANPAQPPSGQPPLYGGWKKATMWQYALDIVTCSMNTDRSTILEVVTPPTPAPPDEEEEEVMLAHCNDAPEVGGNRYRIYFMGDQPPKWIVSGANANVLMAIHGPPKVIPWAVLKSLGAT